MMRGSRRNRVHCPEQQQWPCLSQYPADLYSQREHSLVAEE